MEIAKRLNANGFVSWEIECNANNNIFSGSFISEPKNEEEIISMMKAFGFYVKNVNIDSVKNGLVSFNCNLT